MRREITLGLKVLTCLEIGEIHVWSFLIGMEVAFNKFIELTSQRIESYLETTLQPGNGLLAPPVKKGIDYVRQSFSQSCSQDYGR